MKKYFCDICRAELKPGFEVLKIERLSEIQTFELCDVCIKKIKERISDMKYEVVE